MKIMDWLKLIKDEHNSFHCETEELANEFLTIAHNLGYKWISGTSLLDVNHWDIWEENTCYCFSKEDGGFSYARMDIVRSWVFNVINVKELLYGRKPFKLKR